MWERFGDSAQKVVAHAQEEAGRLGHNYIGTEHLLLGVLRERTSRGAEALAARGVSLGAVRKRIDDIVGKGTAPAAGPIPFVPRAKRVLQLAVGEAETMGHHLVDPEHIVLAILAEGEGVAARILRDLGVSEQAVRDRLGKKRPSQ
jgi:ATP-dependent Clp protease ATP-binding subunit ClpC